MTACRTATEKGGATGLLLRKSGLGFAKQTGNWMGYSAESRLSRSDQVTPPGVRTHVGPAWEMEPFREPSLSQAVPWSTGNTSQPLVEAQGASCTLRLLAGVDAGTETMGKGKHLCFITNTRLSPRPYRVPEAMSLHQGDA